MFASTRPCLLHGDMCALPRLAPQALLPSGESESSSV